MLLSQCNGYTVTTTSCFDRFFRDLLWIGKSICHQVWNLLGKWRPKNKKVSSRKRDSTFGCYRCLFPWGWNDRWWKKQLHRKRSTLSGRQSDRNPGETVGIWQAFTQRWLKIDNQEACVQVDHCVIKHWLHIVTTGSGSVDLGLFGQFGILTIVSWFVQQSGAQQWPRY